jgi:uncharacterized membrane protein YfcA
MTSSELALAAVVMAAGSTVQGTVGFGQALVAAPLLLLIDTRLVPGPATVAGVVLSLLLVARERADRPPGNVAWALAGLVPGTAVAGVALAAMSTTALAVTAGVAVLAAVALSVAGLHPRPTATVLLGAGIVSGFMGTTAAVSGPPLALLYQREPGPTIRVTMARFFLVSSALTACALVPAGKLGTTELVAGLVMAPGGVAGFALSRLLVGRVDAGATRMAVLTVSAVSAVAVLARALT